MPFPQQVMIGRGEPASLSSSRPTSTHNRVSILMVLPLVDADVTAQRAEPTPRPTRRDRVLSASDSIGAGYGSRSLVG
jgi:hypothetical protein